MAKIDISPYEKGLFLSHILKKSREYVLAHPKIRLNKKQEQLLHQMTTRRLKNEPMAYILGHKGFYGMDFKVTPDTLIPRPETEHLVDAVISNLKLVIRNKKASIIDIGTGSGNIIISIAKELEKSKLPITNYQLLSTDISKKALGIARYNAKKHKVNKRIRFIKSNLLDYFIKHRLSNIKQLMIIANLPYLSKKVYENSMPDVKNYEPKIALLSGNDGLNHYKKLFNQIQKLLITSYKLRVTIYIEFGPEQKSKLEKLVKKYFPKSNPIFRRDLARRWRIISFSI